MSESSVFIKEVARLESLSKRTAPLIAAGLAIVIAALIYAILQLSRINNDIEQANQRRSDITQAVWDAESRLVALRSEIDGLTDQLALAKQSGNEIQVSQAVEAAAANAERIQQSVEEAQAELVAAAPTPPRPRVYFHIANEQQRSMAADVSRTLASSGDVIVPGIQLVGDSSPTATELRYFKTSERALAEEVGGRIQAAGIAVRVKYVPGYENSKSIRPNHLELWIAATQ